MMLDNYVRDFKALIDWIQLQEKLEKTDAQNRCIFSFFVLLPFFIACLLACLLALPHSHPHLQLLPEVKLEVLVSGPWL